MDERAREHTCKCGTVFLRNVNSSPLCRGCKRKRELKRTKKMRGGETLDVPKRMWVSMAAHIKHLNAPAWSRGQK